MIDAVVPAGAAQVLATTFASERDQVRGAIALGDQLEQIQAARNALAETGTSLYASLATAEKSAGGVGGRFANPWIPLALLGITLAALLAALYLHRSLANLRREADSQTRQNERNQQAILRLLDELSSLADGDLTVQATVTEDITGAIADSINYAIEALRELVTTINDSAIKLDGATRQTQALSTHLAKASAAQSKQIAAASESITAMASSTEEVSGNAERSADVARHSVDIAAKGGDAVRRTIDGMNAIRENIQETSKRIKRLGESSQEIGNIVELINDIAEQTNILALNASIQASMAGEAGRGFAVVADEVQRLAERAANATKQIEVLVRTIQADTNEAVVSMERTTTDVVGGALLAENAGAALEEIEKVSNQIASLVQNISASSRQQAGDVAEHLAQHAGAARDQLADGREHDGDLGLDRQARRARRAVAQSVAGFRLPEATANALGDPSGEYPTLRPDSPSVQRHARSAAGERAHGLRPGESIVTTEPLPIAAVGGIVRLAAARGAGGVDRAQRGAHRARGLWRTARRARDCIERFAAHLHLARGALRVAEVYGGALLAEEMEHVAQYVAAHTVQGKTDPDGLDALLRAMEQLPSYLDRVASGGRDVPLALLPLLNDLRAVRGSALLSEGTLLMLNLRSDEPARPITTGGGGELAELARRLRPRFQVALLGLIRGESTTHQLAALSHIAEQLEGTAAAQPLFQLWWVVGAVLEALRDNGVENSVSIKRLLGHADREITPPAGQRRAALQRESARRAAEQPAFLRRAGLIERTARERRCAARSVSTICCPRDDQLDEARETLSAPSVRLMKTVAAAIREDLTRVKDVLDIFVRRGATQVEDLVPQLEMLRKISDTLGVLGLGALRDRVQGEIESLRAIVDRRQPPDDTSLLGIAAALIEVEDSLDWPARPADPAGSRWQCARGEPDDGEFRAVQDAVLRECIVNMARIKEAITQALTAPTESQGLDQVPQLVRGITAGLLMLGKQRAVEVMEGDRSRSRSSRAPGSRGTDAPRTRASGRRDRRGRVLHGDAPGRAPDNWNMLNNAEAFRRRSMKRSRGSLRCAPPRPSARRPRVVARSGHAPLRAGPAGRRPPVAVAAVRRAEVRAARAASTSADPEFVALFIEEAREVIAGLVERVPVWEQNPAEIDMLRDIRRGFHTLKGSGRMVGAQRVGEFGWSIESLLNRVLSQTLQRSPDIVEIVRDAVACCLGWSMSSSVPGHRRRILPRLMSRADALSGREASALPPPTRRDARKESPARLRKRRG